MGKQQKHKKKGQSTLEYIILVAAVIAALITFLGPAGVFRKTLTNTFTTTTAQMPSLAERLANSYSTQ